MDKDVWVMIEVSYRNDYDEERSSQYFSYFVKKSLFEAYDVAFNKGNLYPDAINDYISDEMIKCFMDDEAFKSCYQITRDLGLHLVLTGARIAD